MVEKLVYEYGKKNYVKLHLKKDGEVWYASYQFYHNSTYMGFAPLPKWGEYKSRISALMAVISGVKANHPAIQYVNGWLNGLLQTEMMF